jgi:hypothetical protein
MSPRIIEDFYIKQQDKLKTQFDKTLHLSKDILQKKINNQRIDSLFVKMRREYESLIPKIPYIGGRKNPFTSMLIDSVNLLAIFRVLENEGYSFNEIGEYSYEFFEKIQKRRKEKAKKSGQKPSDRYFQETYIKYLKKFAKSLQKRIYPDDWVMEFVEGDEKTFDYGFNFTECGIAKLFKKLGSGKYIPFICLSDFVDAQINGFGFKRTQTIGNGSNMCDHRFIKNGTTSRVWPPNELEEYKMTDQGNFTQ